jgi:urease accessory protein UreF
VDEVATAVSSGRGIPGLTARQVDVLAALIASFIVTSLLAAARHAVLGKMEVFRMVYGMIAVLRAIAER